MAARTEARSTHTLPAEAEERQGLRAGVVSRVTVAVVDAFVVALTMGIAYLTYAGLLFARRGVRFTWPAPTWPEVIVFFYAWCVLYLTISWCTTGRSAGKRLFGLRVVGRDGRPPRFSLALLRAVTCVAFPFLLLWSAVNRTNRSVQDVVFRTSVLYDWRSRWDRSPHASRQDAVGVGVDVASPVADEANHGDAEPVAGADGE